MASRRRARQRALQILFLWDVSKQPIRDAVAAYDEIVYSDEEKVRPQRDEFLQQLVTGTVEHVGDIDRYITQHAEHWRRRLLELLEARILDRVLNAAGGEAALNQLARDVALRQKDPFAAVSELLAKSGLV